MFVEVMHEQMQELRYEASALRNLASALEYVGQAQLAEDLYKSAARLDQVRATLETGWSQELSRQVSASQESSRTLLQAIFAGMAIRDLEDE